MALFLLYRRRTPIAGGHPVFFSMRRAVTDRLLGGTVRAVFFDAVGTLIHPEPSAGEVYLRVGRRFGSQLTAETIRHRFAAAFQREEERDRADGLRTSEPREAQRWRSIVAGVLDDVTDAEACFAELFAHFAKPEAWRCEPEAAETIRGLAERGLKVGMASNFDARLRGVAAGLPGLLGLQSLVISSEVGWRKPAPQLFAAICTEARQAPEAIVYVGDDTSNDYDGACAAGFQAILYDPAGRESGERSRIGRLSDLLRGSLSPRSS